VVTRTLGIRVALLGAWLRGGALRAVGLIVCILLGAAGALGLAWVPLLLAHGDGSLLDQYDTVTASAVAIVAVLISFFSGRNHFDARSFATFPASAGKIATAILATGWCTWSMLGVLAWLVARAALRPDWWEVPWAVVVGSLLTYFAIITVVRVASGLSRLLFVSGILRTLRRTLGILVIAAALPLGVFGVTSIVRDEDRGLRDASSVFAWFPSGAGTASIADAVSDDLATMTLRWLAVLVAIAIFAGIWYSLVTIALQTMPAPERSRLARSGLGWFEYFGDRPAQVIAARTLTYWRRDPRYGVGLWALPIAPIIMTVALLIAGVEWQIVVLLPLPVILFLLGWSIHNDVAMDSTAIWLHVTSGTRGRDDRIGRLAPIALIGVPLLLLGSSVTATVIGDWQVFPAVLGLNAAVLMISAGVSNIASARWPYPSTRPGDSPFQQPQWAGSGSAIAQTVSILGGVVLSVPALWTAIEALQEPHEFMPVMIACVVGIGSGLVVLTLAVLIGGRIFDRSGPELVAVTETYD
jgi:ABC-2 type transport system permease protein